MMNQMDIIDLDSETALGEENGCLMMLTQQMLPTHPNPRVIQRRELTLADKIEFIKFYEAAPGGMSIRGIAKKFNIGRTAALGILKRKEEHLKHYSLNVGSNRRRIRHSKFHEVNQCTWKWYMVARFQRQAVTGPRLQEKALKFANRLGIPSFKASNGWLDSFKKTYNIHQQLGKSTELSFMANFDWKSKIPHLTSDFGLENVFSHKVTAIYYRALPQKTLPAKFVTNFEENAARMLEERLTVMLCCSAFGEKLTPWVVGSPNHKLVSKSDLDLTWKTSSDTNISLEILLSFLENLNVQLQQKSRRIMIFFDYLLIDIPDFSHITVNFFPMNTAANCHPMDLGVLDFFKASYRKCFLERFFETSSGQIKNSLPQNGGDFLHSVSISDALSWIPKAWEAVNSDSIMKSFDDAGFTLPHYIPPSGCAEQLYSELGSLIEAIPKTMDSMTVDEYISFDKFCIADSPSEEDLEDQITNEVISERNASPEELLSLNIEMGDEELQYPEDDKAALPGSEMTHDEALETVGRLRHFALNKESCLLPLINDLKGLLESVISEQVKRK